MKALLTKTVLSGVAIAIMSGCGPSSYNGLVNVVAVGAGEKPTTKSDRNYVDTSSLPNIVVFHTPNLKIKEQKVSKNVKYIAGEALEKEYSGEPKIMVDYLNAYQNIDNKVLILDKKGIVAWSGAFKTNNITSAVGVYDYGLTGAKRMSFSDAMEKFVLDQDEAEFDEDKKIKFPQGNKDSFAAGFSYAGKYPLLMTKFPDMKLGTTTLSAIESNNKPTVLVFFMSKDTQSGTMQADVNKVTNMIGAFTGAAKVGSPKPQKVLNDIEEIYLKK